MDLRPKPSTVINHMISRGPLKSQYQLEKETEVDRKLAQHGNRLPKSEPVAGREKNQVQKVADRLLEANVEHNRSCGLMDRKTTNRKLLRKQARILILKEGQKRREQKRNAQFDQIANKTETERKP